MKCRQRALFVDTNLILRVVTFAVTAAFFSHGTKGFLADVGSLWTLWI